MSSPLLDSILDHLDHIRILPRRLILCTPGSEPTVPMLRGVWGAALHQLNRPVYDKVFGPEGGDLPLYLMRAGLPIPRESPAVEHFLFNAAIDSDTILLQAWMRACDTGLGPNREPFFLRGYTMGPDSSRLDSDSFWKMSELFWPLHGPAWCDPVIIRFPLPVRLLRNKMLITDPMLPDLVVSITRRIGNLLPVQHQDSWREVSHACLDLSREIIAEPWIGGPCDAWRWSARQQSEIQLRGITGELALPDGAGELWPLLVAATWLHMGKGTVFGMGQAELVPFVH